MPHNKMPVAFRISIPLFGFPPPSLPVAAHHTAFGGADNPVAVQMRMRQPNDHHSRTMGILLARRLAEAEPSNMWARSAVFGTSERTNIREKRNSRIQGRFQAC